MSALTLYQLEIFPQLIFELLRVFNAFPDYFLFKKVRRAIGKYLHEALLFLLIALTRQDLDPPFVLLYVVASALQLSKILVPSILPIHCGLEPVGASDGVLRVLWTL